MIRSTGNATCGRIPMALEPIIGDIGLPARDLSKICRTEMETDMRKLFEQLSEEETRAWVKELIERLKKKQVRERAYLDRRKARGVHTPTDEAYESDQELEDDLLAILEQLAKE
jgi:phosphoenolpyruvate carboxylase